MIANIFLASIWLLVWMALSWPPEVEDIIIGIPVSIFVLIMTRDMFSKKPALIRSPMHYVWFLIYVLVFIWECVKANFDVAFRVLHPDLPIKPGTIKVKTHLKSDIALTFLANSITLTPGTTSVDIDKDNGYLYVHWLYMKKGYDRHKMRLPIVDKFEGILKRIFE